MTAVNVALVGYGYVGRTFHAPLISAVDGLTLHTVVSSRPGAVHADWPLVRVAPELNAVLSDAAIDLVVLATPNVLHAPQALAALEAGKNVVVDKPFTVTLEEAEQVAAAAERGGRLVSVFHNRRWDSDFLTLRALLEQGALGDVTAFASHFDRFRPVVRDRWRERAGPGAGLWFDLGPHLLDQALQLFGAPSGITVDLSMQREGAEVDDYFHAVLRYERLRVLLHASVLVAASDLRFAVHGTRGSFIKQGLDGQEAALKAGGVPGEGAWGVDEQPGTLTFVDGDRLATRTVAGERGDYRRYYSAVRDAITEGGANPAPAEDAIAVMRLLEAGVESSRTGCEVRVEH